MILDRIFGFYRAALWVKLGRARPPPAIRLLTTDPRLFSVVPLLLLAVAVVEVEVVEVGAELDVGWNPFCALLSGR